MKKKRKPGVFFIDPSDDEVSRETKKTVRTFIELEEEPVDTDNLSGEFKRIIDVKFDNDKKDE
ncbi:MAG TPA: hypothetical protein PLP30_06610 [Clostridia bacterium]|nr:hypothetical protein [Clostridia bacterium]HPQ47020.1 hypothetical protein [Clostridia bacterium]HRX42368.1 hypothetical protein [Clostridia bacterium]